MSLNVPSDLLERAGAGEVPDAEFVACVRESLPYAWTVISDVAAELHSDGGDFADHAVPPPVRRSGDSCCGRWPATRSAAGWNAISG